MAKSELFNQLTQWSNLLLAAKKAKSGKRFRQDVLSYNYDCETRLYELQQQLVHDCYKPGKYRSFEIQDPKRRLISAAPYSDRVLHHAICNVIEPILEKRFVYDSYACRKNKGQVAALKRCQYYGRRIPFVLKVDFKKYFPSIDHDILISKISRIFSDRKLINLLRIIIGQPFPGQNLPTFFRGDDLFSQAEKHCGIPIGNQTSQLFGNFYLDHLDHYIKEVMRVPGYVRYMDDLLLFSNSKSEAWNYLEQLDQLAEKIRLRLHPRKQNVIPTDREFPFLGFHVGQRGFRPFAKTVTRFRRRLNVLQRQLDQGQIDLAAVRQSIASYGGHFKIAKQTNRWRKIVSDFPFYRLLMNESRRP